MTILGLLAKRLVKGESGRERSRSQPDRSHDKPLGSCDKSEEARLSHVTSKKCYYVKMQDQYSQAISGHIGVN